ncbi:hypothetical protein [Streptomyces sp. JV190]|uniref:hypothetical protein n=1 Tax=Streptomyces sp. JV190 TaxID=3002533 RepID=UPI002E781156|nr:hypothetical protein [Streptomyces sp. JV190]MEE1845557.1 hypothetical protein [Streptomyces sp. JV190]
MGVVVGLAPAHGPAYGPARSPGSSRSSCLTGLVLLPGLALLVHGLSEAGSAGGFGSGKVTGGLLVGAVLLLPQSLGYLLAIVLMNALTARLGVRNLTIIGIVPYALIDAHPNQLLLGATLVVRGFGLGASMMPTMTIAFASVPKETAPSATSAFNVFQRVGASLGTTVLAVVLQQRLKDELPVGVDSLGQVEPGGTVARGLAESFGAPFWWAMVFTALALLPAFFLPGRRPAADNSAGGASEVPPARGSETAILTD